LTSFASDFSSQLATICEICVLSLLESRGSQGRILLVKNENDILAMAMTLSSPAFQQSGHVPTKYTCEGDDVSPPLAWEGVPNGAPENAGRVGLPQGTLLGLNDFKKTGYGGPCPPIGRHRYFHKLYALDITLDLRGVTKPQVERAMQGHVLANAELIGTYQKER
jgi:phosphatidylethanolamine-binding protein (PEBP) family uncharacterized protein